MEHVSASVYLDGHSSDTGVLKGRGALATPRAPKPPKSPKQPKSPKSPKPCSEARPKSKPPSRRRQPLSLPLPLPLALALALTLTLTPTPTPTPARDEFEHAIVLVQSLRDAKVRDLEDAVHAHLVRVRVRVKG